MAIVAFRQSKRPRARPNSVGAKRGHRALVQKSSPAGQDIITLAFGLLAPLI